MCVCARRNVSIRHSYCDCLRVRTRERERERERKKGISLIFSVLSCSISIGVCLSSITDWFD
jgi:hypothetical protein